MANRRAAAAVLSAPEGKLEILDVEVADPREGQILVRIAGSGVCHSDAAMLDPETSFVDLPAVLGHEGAGVVEEVGPGVTSVRPGDHVVLSFDSCGACESCAESLPSYCEEFIPRNVFGFGMDGVSPLTGPDGDPIAGCFFGQSSWTTLAIAGERTAVVVDKDVPLDLAGTLGCGFQTGAGAIFTSLDVRAGQNVSVFGAGAVGLAAIMAARVVGAGAIVAVDPHPARRELALELGATHALDPVDPDLLPHKIMALTNGCHYSLDTSGNGGAIVAALQSLRSHGQLGLVGALPSEFDLNHLMFKRMKFIIEGDAVPQVLVPRLIELWRAGQFPFDRLITRFPLESVNEAIQATLSGEVVKPVLVP